MDTQALGNASMLLGAGRTTKDSPIDYQAGIILHKKTGMKVNKGDRLATLVAKDSGKMTQARKVLGAAYYYGESPAKKKPIIIARGNKNGIRRY